MQNQINMCRNIYIFLLLIIFSSGISCKEELKEKNAMKAKISLSQQKVNDPHDMEIKVILINTGAQDLKLWLLSMNYPSLYIEVKDASGKIIGNIPPSVPPENAEETNIRVLKPGDSLHYTTTGIPVSDSFLKKGIYQVRCNTELPGGEEGKEQFILQSDWVPVEIE